MCQCAKRVLSVMMQAMTETVDLHNMDEAQMRQLVQRLMGELKHKQALLDKLAYEMALLKRLKFAAKTEALNTDQRSLLEEALEEDLQAVQEEIEQMQPVAERAERAQPKRLPLPAQLPRQHFEHEPQQNECCGQSMRRIGEDVAEKLDYQPGVFTVHRHVRGKWVCKCCERIVQAPVPAHVIDKGIPTTGLLAHVLVAKFMDHLPLYRQEAVFARAGHVIARSTLAEWVGACGAQLQPLVQALADELRRHMVLHADETPVAMLDPGAGKTHRAYLWSYSIGAFEPVKVVVYDFADSRAGKHAREFLGDWRGTLVCDDYSGYKALIADGVTEAGCMAHARRKFFDLHANNQSQIAQQALNYCQRLYLVEREVADLSPGERE